MMKQMARGSLDHASSKENPALWYGGRGTEAAITIEKLPSHVFVNLCQKSALITSNRTHLARAFILAIMTEAFSLCRRPTSANEATCAIVLLRA